MQYILIAAGLLVCAIQAVRAHRLLPSALWLAGASALVSLLMYMLGAPEVAVIELSVGAGLVTVLFVFAINIAGEEPLTQKPLLPQWLAWVFVLIAALLMGWLILPILNVALPGPSYTDFTTSLWQNRSLDVLLQIILIFAGVLGVLGLLEEGKHNEAEEI
ncbi:MAG: NADH-quinone oxidoreductase subunit J [Anaerolineaceae bacterium]|nr:NADH-quinone oxidoreductase subunit J [Anaerolineaceae bacterium]